jgi:hypothetical protein
MINVWSVCSTYFCSSVLSDGSNVHIWCICWNLLILWWDILLFFIFSNYIFPSQYILSILIQRTILRITFIPTFISSGRKLLISIFNTSSCQLVIKVSNSYLISSGTSNSLSVWKILLINIQITKLLGGSTLFKFIYHLVYLLYAYFACVVFIKNFKYLFILLNIKVEFIRFLLFK